MSDNKGSSPDAAAAREMTRMGQRIGYLTKGAAQRGAKLGKASNPRPTLPREGGAR